MLIGEMPVPALVSRFGMSNSTDDTVSYIWLTNLSHTLEYIAKIFLNVCVKLYHMSHRSNQVE